MCVFNDTPQFTDFMLCFFFVFFFQIVCDAIGKGQCGLCIEVNGCVPPDTPPTSSCNDDYRDTELILLSSGHNVNHHSGAVETLLIEKWILSLIPYNRYTYSVI